MVNTLTVTGSGNTDFTLDTTTDVNAVLFNTTGFATAVFFASQWNFATWTIADSVSINGSTGVDTITGGDGAGGNTIHGGLGADQLTGGAGPDLFRYSAGAEIQAGESLTGGGAFDVIQVNCDGSSYDFSGATISGVEDISMNLGGVTGSATVTFSGNQLRAGGITNVFDSTYTDTLIVICASIDLSGVTFQNWTNGTDTLNLIGTGGADSVIGSDQDDLIQGLNGPDVLNGGAGGNDTFLIAGNEGLGDSFVGGTGTDTLKVTGASAVTLAGFNATASSIEHWAGNGNGVSGNAAANSFDFSGLTSKLGLAFVDGGLGIDTITGSKFVDDLRGGTGNDTLNGGEGNDTLTGGAGRDKLTGGANADRFDFNKIGESVKGSNHDTIVDFKHIQHDKIDLVGIDANTTHGGNQKFAFIGHHAFDGKAGEVHFVKHSGFVMVEGDVNGDGVADVQIKVAGFSTLIAGDFVL
jgi:Ca2+-binding RTX toxin-like protein